MIAIVSWANSPKHIYRDRSLQGSIRVSEMGTVSLVIYNGGLQGDFVTGWIRDFNIPMIGISFP